MVVVVSRTAVIFEHRQNLQLARHFDFEVLARGLSVNPVYCQVNSEFSFPGVGVRDFRTGCVRAVAKIPVIPNGRHAVCVRSR